MDLAWVRAASQLRWRNMRRALASDAPSGTATREMNRFPTSRSPKSLKVIWRRRRAWMTIVGRWGLTRRKWLKSRQAFGEFFPIFRGRWNCRLRNSAAIFSRVFQRRWLAWPEPVHNYLYLKIFIGRTNPRWRF